jgi:uncharacterized protein (TIRG00374 family)
MKIKKYIFFFTKLLISFGLIFFVFSSINLSRIKTILQDLHPFYFFAALILALLNSVIATYRWRIVLKVPNITIQYKNLLSLFFVGFFFNTFMPGNIGGDILRGYDLGRVSGRNKESYISIFMDKIIALLSLMLITLVSCYFAGQEILETRLFFVVLLILSIFTVVVFLFFYSSILKHFIILLNSVKLRRTHDLLYDLFQHLSLYKRRLDAIALAFIVSFLSHCVLIFTIFCLSLSVQSTVNLRFFFLIVPIVIFLSMIPISIAGLGIRESGFAYFFPLVGMGKESALLIGLLFFFLLIINGLIGALIYLSRDIRSYRKFDEKGDFMTFNTSE